MPTSSSFFMLGDYVGEESCGDLTLIPLLEKANEDYAAAVVESRMTLKRSQRWEMKEKMKGKEYPPPIPLLAQTENLQSRMPWVLQRTYTSDGRLILSEEPVDHHEYFLVDRKDGRLTLDLVPLNDEVFDGRNEDESKDEHMPESDDNAPFLNHDMGGIDIDDDEMQCLDIVNRKRADVILDCRLQADDSGELVDGVEVSTSPTTDVGGGVGKCIKVYNIPGGGSSSIFGVPVAVPAL